MATVRCPAPQPLLTLLNAAGNRVGPINIPNQQPKEVEASVWIHAIMVPSGTSGNIDHVNGTSSGWTSVAVDKSSSLAINAGKYFLLTGKIKDGATTALVDNRVIVTINSVEIARLYVCADTQTIGWTAFQLPGDRQDDRFALSGTSTTGDLLFALTSADPALELHLLLLGDD